MTVNTLHPQYKKYVDTWQKTRDAVCGSVAVKDKGDIYLPRPNEKEADSLARYKHYKARAVFTNFTARTKNALVGAAFRQDPEVDFPPGLEYLAEDATGDGLSIFQMAKDSLGNLMEAGREGFLVDYPEAPEGLSAEETNMLDYKAHIVPYVAEAIVNWRTASVNGRNMLVLVVLKESYKIDEDDEFSHDCEDQYRVLRLDEIGYSQQVYRDGEPWSEINYPTDANGETFKEIPFIFAGAKNNDSTVDDAPLADIAEINLAHYRNSADYEESAFLCGQPTLFLTTSLSVEEWKKANPDGILLGSRAGHNLGETGSADLVQAAPNSLVKEAMAMKEQQMIMIGARIITDRGGNETAEAARIRFSSENSVLGDVVKNLSEAIRVCIEWCGQFMGTEGDAVFEISTNFYDKSIDPQMVMAYIQLQDRGNIAVSDVNEALRKAGYITRTDEEISQEVGQLDPLT